MRYEFNLSFAQTECPRCGDIRITGVVCTICGSPPDPREADLKRQRREKLAASILERLAKQGAGSDPITQGKPLHVMWESLESWLEDFLSQLSAFAAEPGEKTTVLGAVDRLIELEATSRSIRRLRPSLPLFKIQDELIAYFRRIANLYAAAFAATTPLEAQCKAIEAQRALDDATGLLGAFQTQADRSKRIEAAATSEEAIKILVLESRASTGAASLLEFDAAGGKFYELVTGSKECPTGLGAGLLITATQVESVLDEERFWSVTSNVYDFLNSDVERLGEVAGLPAWKEDFVESIQLLSDAGLVLKALLASARRNRHEIRALLDFGHALVEGPAKRSLATLLCIKDGRKYERLRVRDAADLLAMGRQNNFGGILIGLDRNVRNARAHENFEVDGDWVTLNPGRPDEEILDVDALVDRVLTGLESILAIHTGIVCAAEAAGVELETLGSLEDLDFPWGERVSLALTMSGWSEVNVCQEGKTVVIGGAYPAASLPMAVAASVFHEIPENLELLLLHWTDSAGLAHELQGPLTPFRQRTKSNHDLERQVLFVQGTHQWSLDGQPVTSRAFVRKWAAVQASSVLSNDSDQVPNLRMLRGLGTALHDEEMVAAINAYMAASRNRYLNLPNDEVIHDEIGKMREWTKYNPRVEES